MTTFFHLCPQLVIYLLEGTAGFCAYFSDTLIFGIAARGLTAGFYTDLAHGPAKRSIEFLCLSLEYCATHPASANADGGGVEEDQFLQSRYKLLITQNAQQAARPVFLHVYGSAEGISGPFFKKLFHEKTQCFTAAVINVCLQLHDVRV